MPAHVVYGDTFLVARQVRRIRREAGADDLMESNRQRVVAGSAQPADVLGMCQSMPFLEPVRLVEVEGALATQESSGGGASSRSRGRDPAPALDGGAAGPDPAAAPTGGCCWPSLSIECLIVRC